MSIPGVTVHFHTLVLRLSTTCLSWGPQLGMVTTVAWQWPLLAPWGLLGGDRGATAGPQSHRGVPSPATAAPPTPNLGHGGASSRAPAMGWGDKISPAPGTGATGLAGPKWSRGVAVAETCSKLCVKLLACPSLLPLWKELFLGICQQGVFCPSRRVQDHHPPPPVLGFTRGHPDPAVPKGFGGSGNAWSERSDAPAVPLPTALALSPLSPPAREWGRGYFWAMPVPVTSSCCPGDVSGLPQLLQGQGHSE